MQRLAWVVLMPVAILVAVALPRSASAQVLYDYRAWTKSVLGIDVGEKKSSGSATEGTQQVPSQAEREATERRLQMEMAYVSMMGEMLATADRAMRGVMQFGCPGCGNPSIFELQPYPTPVISGVSGQSTFGARFTVPFGRYNGDGLWEPNEQYDYVGGSAAFYASYVDRREPGRDANLARLYPQAPPDPWGWSFEPGVFLTEVPVPTTFQIPGDPVQQCRVQMRYSYSSQGTNVDFTGPSGVSACTAFVTNQTPGCASDQMLEQSGCRNQKIFVARNGGAILDISNRDAPVIHWPDGRREVFGIDVGAKRNWELSPFSSGPWPKMAWIIDRVVDPNGNIGRFVHDDKGQVTAMVDPQGRQTRFVRSANNGEIQEIDAPGPGGADLRYLLNWADRTYTVPAGDFDDMVCFYTDPFRGLVATPCFWLSPSYRTLDSLRLPDGRSYTFTYNGLGYLTRVTLPDGAVSEFIYGDKNTPVILPSGWFTDYFEVGAPAHEQENLVPELTRQLLKRRLVESIVHPNGQLTCPADGSSTTGCLRTRYTYQMPAGADLPGMCQRITWSITTFPDGARLREGACTGRLRGLHGYVIAQEKYAPGGTVPVEATYYGDPATGELYLDWEEATDPGFNVVDHVLMDVRPTRIVHVRDGARWMEDRVYQEGGQGTLPFAVTRRCGSCSASRVTGNVLRSAIRDGAGGLLRQTTTAYLGGAAYSSYTPGAVHHLVRHPASITVSDGTGAILSRKEHRYDETPILGTPIPAERLDRGVGSARGNPTSTIDYLAPAAAAAPIVETVSYYESGQTYVATSGRGLGTTYQHDFAACGASHPVLTEKVTNALGHTAITTSDCFTGAVLSIEGPDGARTCNQYDHWGRLVATAGTGDALPPLPTGGVAGSCTGAGGPTTRTVYLPAEVNGVIANGPAAIFTFNKDGTDEGLYSRTFKDGLGRTVETCAEAVSPSELNPDSDQAATVERCVHTTFGLDGRQAEVSDPYVRGRGEAPSSGRPSGALFVRTRYDVLGRPTSEEHVGSGLAAVTTAYSSESGRFVSAVTVPAQQQDQTQTAERVTRTYRNLLGHVDEVRRKWSGCDGGFCSTWMENDALGQVRKITDALGNVTRFEYDGLGRRTAVSDPDMGTWRYGYDANGNLVVQNDGKGQMIRMTYDALERMTVKDVPPVGLDEQDVTYTYDGDAPTSCGSCEDFCAATTDSCDTTTMTCRHVLASGASACAPADSPPATAGCGAMAPGRSLARDQSVASCDGRFVLSMQGDGNLVLYSIAESPAVALWATNVVGNEVVMQGDGNLVVYVPGRPVWASITDGHPGAFLAIQNDGNAVIYEGDRALWSSGTGGHYPPVGSGAPCGVLPAERSLPVGGSITSCDGRFRFTFQSDGNVVLYQNPSTAIWATATNGTDRTSLALENSGNLVLRARSWQAVWASGTFAPGAWLSVQNDGNTVLYQGTRPIWATNTCCR